MAEPQDIEMVPDAEAGGDTAPEAKLAKLKAELARCETERKEHLDGWQRARADLANYRKDEVRRFEELARFAAEGLIADALPILDSFDLALGHAMPKEVERGIVLIRSQLEDVLRRRGLEVIPALGQRFDPSLHEAIGTVEGAGEDEAIAEELQRGYRLNGKVIRPARVKIVKRKV